MDMKDKVAVITGAANGIGKALARRFHAAGAKGIVIADRDLEGAQRVAAELGAAAIECDVSQESQIVAAVKLAESEFGPVDMFVSNAGFGTGDQGPLAASASNDIWQRAWDVHVMSHVFAARAVLPSMIERGTGYFLNVASAAGLLTQVGDAAYSTTKHAAVGFAESLAVRHGDQGIRVSVLCPQYVATSIIGVDDEAETDLPPGVLSTGQLVDAVMQGIDEERFMLLPHPEVGKFHQLKVSDYQRWIKSMQRLKAATVSEQGDVDFALMHEIVGGGKK